MSRYRHVALFVFLAALWGLSFPAIKAGLPDAPPILFAAGRYDTAGVFMFGYVLAAGGAWLPESRDDLLAILAGGAFLVGGNSLVFLGEQYTTSAVAAVIFSLIPILTTAFAWLLLPGHRYSATSVVGVVLGLAGVYVIARPDPSEMFVAGSIGQLLVLAAAALVSLGSVLVERTDPSLSTASLTAWSMAVGGVLLHAMSLGAGESMAAIDLTSSLVGAVLYLGVFASAVAYLVYFFLLDRFGPLEVNTVSYLAPVVAALAGWLALDETITVPTVTGFLVIVAGFVLLKHEELREEVSTWLAAV